MVKTNVRFLALSLLMPAMALAGWMPTQRDGAHAVVGGLLAFVQNKVGYQGQGLVLAKKQDAALADHAKAAAASWTFGDGAVAAAFGRFHVEYAGKYTNSLANQADTTVTLRDQFAATFGKIAVNTFNNDWKVDSKTFTTAIDPFFVAATAQVLWSKRASLWNSAQAAEAAAQAAYNAKKK